jgi:hypothetical protein
MNIKISVKQEPPVDIRDKDTRNSLSVKIRETRVVFREGDIVTAAYEMNSSIDLKYKLVEFRIVTISHGELHVALTMLAGCIVKSVGLIILKRPKVSEFLMISANALDRGTLIIEEQEETRDVK